MFLSQLLHQEGCEVNLSNLFRENLENKLVFHHRGLTPSAHVLLHSLGEILILSHSKVIVYATPERFLKH